MWTKLLPEADGCNLMFLPKATEGGQKFCRRLGSSLAWEGLGMGVWGYPHVHYLQTIPTTC